MNQIGLLYFVTKEAGFRVRGHFRNDDAFLLSMTSNTENQGLNGT
jgi:hypothetical protein